MSRLILAALAVITLGWLAGAAILMNVVGIVHAWWRFVPTMPYSVALKIGAAYLIAALIAELLKALAGGRDR